MQDLLDEAVDFRLQKTVDIEASADHADFDPAGCSHWLQALAQLRAALPFYAVIGCR